MNKNEWSSKGVFILAAIGSAAGLGNLWKFPYLVYDNGGLSFIIAYLFMLIFVGLGLLVGEIALGQKSRKGFSGALEEIFPYFKWLGWATVGFAFTILTYYVVVIGWGIDYLYYSFQGLFSGVLPWASDSSGFFFNNILGITSGVGEKGSLSTPIFIGTLITLILTYFFTFKSARSVGKVILVTATIPFVTLFLLAIRGITLPGASDGIGYLTTLNIDKLLELSTWTAAGGQIFFTLSVAMGVMVAYGALKKEKSELVKATFMVAIGNTIISFLSAITVFGTLGYLAHIKGVDVTEVVKGGPSLVFTVLPETLTHFASFSALFSIIFFLTIFLLAIDSAMSLVEAVTLPLKEKFKNIPTELLTLLVIILVGIVSTIYIYGNGLYVLDIIDHYITTLAMLITGFLELIIFVYYSKKLTKYISSRSDSNIKKIFSKKFFLFSWLLGILVVGFLLIMNFKSGFLVYDSYNMKDLVVYGLIPTFIIFIVSVITNIVELKRN